MIRMNIAAGAQSVNVMLWSCEQAIDTGVSLNVSELIHLCYGCWNKQPHDKRAYLNAKFRREDDGGIGVRELFEHAVVQTVHTNRQSVARLFRAGTLKGKQDAGPAGKWLVNTQVVLKLPRALKIGELREFVPLSDDVKTFVSEPGLCIL